MREIKFRAKNKRYNEWSYGYYWCNYSINNGNLFEETHYIKEIIDDERFNIRDWEVNKETVRTIYRTKR